jgi:hypothetical protein
LLFLEIHVMLKGLWQALSLLPCCFMALILLFTTSMGGMWKGSPLLNNFQAQGKVTPLGGFLFTLTHYQALLKTIVLAPNYIFPSLMNDTQIVGPLNEITRAFDYD